MRLPSAAAVTRRSSISRLDIVISGVGALQGWEGTIMEFYGRGKVAPHCSPVGLAGVELVCAMQRLDHRFLAYKPLPRLGFAVRQMVT
jgi:hypothetical protein